MMAASFVGKIRRWTHRNIMHGRYFRGRRTLTGGAIVLAVVLMAVFAPLLSPHNPNAQLFTPLLPPSSQHFFGTDDLGRGVLSRVIYGARISVIVSLGGVAVGSVVGTFLGLVAALKLGTLETVIMRVVDVLLAFPGIILGITVVVLFGSGNGQVALAVAIFNVPLFARLTHGRVLKEKTLDYVDATISLGASPTRLAWRHLLPNTLPVLLPQLSLAMGGGVLIEAALSFLGFGAQPPAPSWGAMLSASRPYISTSPLLAVFPGLALAFLVIGFNLLGDGIRDVLDPSTSQHRIDGLGHEGEDNVVVNSSKLMP